jgi:hypothetical protein
MTEHCRHALPPHRAPAPTFLDALGVVVPRLPPEDRIVLRRRRLCERVRENALPARDGLAAAGRPLRRERGRRRSRRTAGAGRRPNRQHALGQRQRVRSGLGLSQGRQPAARAQRAEAQSRDREQGHRDRHRDDQRNRRQREPPPPIVAAKAMPRSLCAVLPPSHKNAARSLALARPGPSAAAAPSALSGARGVGAAGAVTR